MSFTINVFQFLSTQYDTGFIQALDADVSTALSAVLPPLSAALVIWIVILGYLMMTGGLDMRYGISKVVTMAIVVGLISSSSLYDLYVQNLFIVDVPSFIATTFGTNSTTTIPQQLDNMLQTFWITGIVLVKQASCYFCVLKPATVVLELILISIPFVLAVGIVFAVYLITHTLIGLLVVVGPFVLIGYLFDATKHIPTNWLGKLIGLMILLLLVTIVLSTFTGGMVDYLNNVISSKTTAEVAEEGILILAELAAYASIIAFLTLLLPGIAAYIGGGISMDLSSLTNPANWFK